MFLPRACLWGFDVVSCLAWLLACFSGSLPLRFCVSEAPHLNAATRHRCTVPSGTLRRMHEVSGHPPRPGSATLLGRPGASAGGSPPPPTLLLRHQEKAMNGRRWRCVFDVVRMVPCGDIIQFLFNRIQQALNKSSKKILWLLGLHMRNALLTFLTMRSHPIAPHPLRPSSRTRLTPPLRTRHPGHRS